jgi:hypothetical protein
VALIEWITLTITVALYLVVIVTASEDIKCNGNSYPDFERYYIRLARGPAQYGPKDIKRIQRAMNTLEK